MKIFASTVEVFSSDTVILDMLNTLHLTIVFTLMLIPTYETFPTFHQCFLRCRLLPSWPSCTSSSLSRTFSPFWPRVTAKKYLDMWDRPCMFLPLWHATLPFTLALTHAQRRVRYHLRSSLHLQCTGIFSTVLSLAAMVWRVIFLVWRRFRDTNFNCIRTRHELGGGLISV